MLRISQHDLMRSATDQIANIVQRSLEHLVAGGRPPAAWARPLLVIAAPLQKLGFRQVFDPLNPFGRVRQVFARP